MRISEGELSEARAAVARTPQSPMERRDKRAALMLLRAHEMHVSGEAMARANAAGSPEADREYQAAEQRVTDLDAQIAQHDIAAGRADDAHVRRNPMAAAARGAHGCGATTGPYLRGTMTEWVEERGLARPGEIDVSEQREFSMGALIRGMVTGQLDPDSPERRVLDGGADSSGGVAVPTLVSAGLIDTLLPQTVIHAAGALAVPMEAGKVDLPKIDALPQPGWRGQGVDVPVSDPTFSKASLNAKTLAVRTDIPIELLEDVSEAAAVSIFDIMAAAIALEVDRVGLTGSGTGDEPQGLFGAAGVNETPIGGPVTGYGEILNAIYAVKGRNANPSAAIMSVRDEQTYAGLVASDGQPLRGPAAVEELPKLSTTSVPTDLGVGTDESIIAVGKFDQMAIGYRPQVGVRIGRGDNLDNLTVKVVAFIRADVAVLRPAAFEVLTGITG